MAKVRSEYDEKMNFRADVRKIIAAEIRLAENHESHSKFHVRLTREGNFRDERKSTSIRAFGWSELKEIGMYFKDKPQLISVDVKCFMKRVEKEFARKRMMEVTLGMRRPDPSPSTKRKATEEAGDRTEKRRA